MYSVAGDGQPAGTRSINSGGWMSVFECMVLLIDYLNNIILIKISKTSHWSKKVLIGLRFLGKPGIFFNN